MRRFALLGALLFAAACAKDRTPVAPDGGIQSTGVTANESDPNDDFHSSPDILPNHGGSHFRLGHFSWRKTGALSAEFKYVVAFRRSAFGAPNVGNILSLVAVNSPGFVGGSVSPPFTVTFVDAANDWFEARATFSKSFTSVGPHAITSTGCCRIGIASTPGWAHINNPDIGVQYWGTVNLNYDGSAATTLPPMVTCAINSTCTFFVTATVPAGLNVRWRMATAGEMGDGSSTQPGPPDAPNGASVDPNTGLYTWNTTAATLYPADPARKVVYSTQVVMEGLDATSGAVVTRSMVDFLILLANVAANAPPAFQPPTPLDGSTYVASPGVPLNLNLSATDADAGDVVTISALGMPAGATLSGAPGNPANSAFSFTASAGQAGQSFAVSFSPTDNHGLSGAQRSIIINVPSNQPPTAVITGPTVAPEGSGIDLDGSGSTDPDGDALHYQWDVNGSPAGGDSPTLHIQVGDGPATLTVKLHVSDGKGGNSGTTHIVTVNNVAPHGLFSAQSPVNEGQSFALNFANVDDPSADDIAAIVQAAFDCGDGSGYGAFSNALNTSCATVDNATRTVRGKLRDKDGGETEYTGSVLVNNLAPVVTIAPAGTISSGGTYNLSGSFSDAGVVDFPWVYQINWGGPTTSGSTSVQGPVNASQNYLVPGTYPITLKVTDKDGGWGTASTTLTVQALAVTCDVKPETINLKGDMQNTGNGNGGGAPSGMVIIHCFSTADVNLSTLVASTGTLGNNVGVETPVARRNNGTYYITTSDDVNGDGRPDLILHFNRSDMIANGDLVAGMPALFFHGVLSDGRHVTGSDAVRVIP